MSALGVRLSHLRVRRTAASTLPVIFVAAGASLLLQHCQAEGCRDGPQVHSGVLCNGLVEVEDSEVWGCSSYGIVASAGGVAHIMRSIIHSCQDSGVNASGEGSVATAMGTTCRNNGAAGFSVDGGAHVQVLAGCISQGNATGFQSLGPLSLLTAAPGTRAEGNTHAGFLAVGARLVASERCVSVGGGMGWQALDCGVVEAGDQCVARAVRLTGFSAVNAGSCMTMGRGCVVEEVAGNGVWAVGGSSMVVGDGCAVSRCTGDGYASSETGSKVVLGASAALRRQRLCCAGWGGDVDGFGLHRACQQLLWAVLQRGRQQADSWGAHPGHLQPTPWHLCSVLSAPDNFTARTTGGLEWSHQLVRHSSLARGAPPWVTVWMGTQLVMQAAG